MASDVSKLQGEIVGECVLQAKVPGRRVRSAQIGVNRQDRARIIVWFRVYWRIAGQLSGRHGWKDRHGGAEAPINLGWLKREHCGFHIARTRNSGCAIV